MKKHLKAKTLALLLSAAMLATPVPGAGLLSPVPVMAAGEDSQASIKSAVIQGDFTGLVYNGTAQTPAYTVTLNGKTLAKDTDYTESWTDNTDAGNAAKLTITGTGSYKDTLEKTFTIAKQTPVVKQAVMVGGTKKETDDTVKNTDYDGTARSFDYIVKGEDGTDLTATLAGITTCTYTSGGKGIDTPTAAGTYAVRISVDPSKGNAGIQKNYNAVTYNGTLNINKIDLSKYTLTLTSGSDYTYTGKAIQPAFQLTKPNSKPDGTAAKDTDYTVSYPNAVNVGGPYIITVTGKGDKYTGSVQAGFYIKASSSTTGYNFAETTDASDTGSHYISFYPASIPDQQWTGKAVTPAPKLTHHWTDANGKAQKEELKQGTDYTVSYEDNKDIGTNTAKAVFTGKGRFKTTTITKKFSIVQKEISDKTISVSLSPASYPYTGKAVTPKVSVTDTSNGRRLTQGTDFTLSCPDRNNTDAGSYIRVKISGAGTYYKGSVEKTFQITAHAISASEFTIDPEVVTVTGTGTSASIAPQTVKVGYTQGGDSRLSTDDITADKIGQADGINGPANFTVSYKNNTAAGTATVTIRGRKNYSGTVTKTFKIIVQNPNAKDLAAKQGGNPLAVVSNIPAQTYTGSQLRPSVTVRYNGVTLGSNDYELSYGPNNAVGTGSVTVTGKNNYKGSVTKFFTVRPASISSVSVSIPSQEYTGGPVRPRVTAVFAGKTLREGTDYRVDYRDNVKVGTAAAILTGTGNFTGTREVSFPIVEKGQGQKKVEATGFTLREQYRVRPGETVTLQPVLIPADANTWQIRWSTSNLGFQFLDGGKTYTGYTGESQPAVVLAPASGETVITGELVINGSVAATARATVKVARIFDDVPESGKYYSDAVYRLADKGIISGVSDTQFNPDGNVTRAQFVTFLYRQAGSPDVAVNTGFTDISGLSAEFQKAVSWAAANGITFGRSDTSFAPRAAVTREEAVTFLFRYAKGGTATKTASFRDVKDGAYYAGAISWGTETGIVKGLSTDNFGVGRNANRGEAVTFIYRTLAG